MPRDIRKICFDILQAVKELEDFTVNKTFFRLSKRQNVADGG